ncbi:hypothetical protein NL676_022056 [Syzygium grande]|nr:hypothetical protein NL676_022056 [Syzygium grande]
MATSFNSRGRSTVGVVVAIAVCILYAGIAAAGRPTTSASMDLLSARGGIRRNLHKNGLGLTPQMGYEITTPFSLVNLLVMEPD